MAGRVIHLVVSFATLLSGALNDCRDGPYDPTCQGGVAAVRAFSRALIGMGTDDSSLLASNTTNSIDTKNLLVLPQIDKWSPFVQMHPLAWNVNRQVHETITGWKAFVSPPSLLLQDRADSPVSTLDLSYLQSQDFPLILSNVAIPPSNSWAPFTRPVWFDQDTRLAVIYIHNSDQPMNWDQVESARGLLNYIARENEKAGCDQDPALCWVPVVLFLDVEAKFHDWVSHILDGHPEPHPHPPALVVYIDTEIPKYAKPTLASNGKTWIASYEPFEIMYHQWNLELDGTGQSFTNVTLTTKNMGADVSEIQGDPLYEQDLDALAVLAEAAQANDPVVGFSTEMPVHREGSYRRCQAGECEVGNLYNDAYLWYTSADIAFSSSGGYRGLGWEPGPVRVSDLWNALPFGNQLCTGRFTGLSMFKLFNYSVSVASFQSEQTSNGGRLLQVAGMRVSYNIQLPPTNRLIALEVWNAETKQFEDVDRGRLYTFVTDSFVCGGYDPYPSLLGVETLMLDGEIPATIIDGPLSQTVVGEYLTSLGTTVYNATIQGRLVNRTDVSTPLDFIQSEDSCRPGEYWAAKRLSCEPCPKQESAVAFLSQDLQFQGSASDAEQESLDNGRGYIRFVSTAATEVAISFKAGPPWVTIASLAPYDPGANDLPIAARNPNSAVGVHITEGAIAFGDEPIVVPPGKTFTINVNVDLANMQPGRSQGTVSFAVLDGGNFPRCVGRDATFEIVVAKSPENDFNYLGDIRLVGYVFGVTIVALTVIGWIIVYVQRNNDIMKALQPYTLAFICLGVLLMGFTIFLMSLDDEQTSEEILDKSCSMIPWLLCMGFSFAISAISAKLNRINRIVSDPEKSKPHVTIEDFAIPFGLVFGANFTTLLIWTAKSPMQWQREILDNESWNSYGSCRAEGRVGTAATATLLAINLLAMIVASYNAYRVWDIEDEVAESKGLGLAVFCSFQLVAVALPVSFAIDEDNPGAKFLLQAACLFLVCLSIVGFTFAPLYWHGNEKVWNATVEAIDREVRLSIMGESTDETRELVSRQERIADDLSSAHISQSMRQASIGSAGDEMSALSASVFSKSHSSSRMNLQEPPQPPSTLDDDEEMSTEFSEEQPATDKSNSEYHPSSRSFSVLERSPNSVRSIHSEVPCSTSHRPGFSSYKDLRRYSSDTDLRSSVPYLHSEVSKDLRRSMPSVHSEGYLAASFLVAENPFVFPPPSVSSSTNSISRNDNDDDDDEQDVPSNSSINFNGNGNKSRVNKASGLEGPPMVETVPEEDSSAFSVASVFDRQLDEVIFAESDE